MLVIRYVCLIVKDTCRVGVLVTADVFEVSMITTGATVGVTGVGLSPINDGDGVIPTLGKGEGVIRC